MAAAAAAAVVVVLVLVLMLTLVLMVHDYCDDNRLSFQTATTNSNTITSRHAAQENRFIFVGSTQISRLREAKLVSIQSVMLKKIRAQLSQLQAIPLFLSGCLARLMLRA